MVDPNRSGRSEVEPPWESEDPIFPQLRRRMGGHPAFNRMLLTRLPVLNKASRIAPTRIAYMSTGPVSKKMKSTKASVRDKGCRLIQQIIGTHSGTFHCDGVST